MRRVTPRTDVPFEPACVERVASTCKLCTSHDFGLLLERILAAWSVLSRPRPSLPEPGPKRSSGM